MSMELLKRSNSKYWIADFTVNGKRYRKSTKQTTKAKASEVAAEFLRQAQRNEMPTRRGQMMKLRQLAEERFLPFVEASTLAEQSKLYYNAGWRMLKALDVVPDMRLDCITTSAADTLKLKGTGSNQNCALRTLRRMLSLAQEYGIIQAAPRIKLRKENQRKRYGMSRLRKLCSKWPRNLSKTFSCSAMIQGCVQM
jgi:hypothetical protein